MSGDYTRFTFDPARGHSGVFKQQGRVSLDANFNEFEEIIDRRSRSQMYDTVGQAVVPRTTQHGFEIQVDASGSLTIGPGRAYVDGVQVECFGDMSDPTKTVRDDDIGGMHGGPIKYAAQPFFYSPGFPALSTTKGAYNLVYLDVWQREVTIYEEPALREPALNGADSDNRVQTAWQVKILSSPDLTANSCAKPPASWDALVAASTARMTADATPSAPSPEPCVINPVGGYTGLENRLYRVEIHTAGSLGGGGGSPVAKFKWSRDNASLAATVLSISKVSATSSTITVSSTGRDSWMRFEHDDHIELLDDWVEWAMRESGTGGPMARVVSVNHATGEIVVDQDLSTFTVVAGRNPRIRRWDRVTSTDPLVQAVNPGTAIPLENGLTITFNGTASDTVHAGDYWVFSARTAQGTIDPPLVDQPPRGILHHFARLALAVTATPMAQPQDCRNFWPPDFGGAECCTVVVDPGQDIQQAIDSLNGVGGCVCLRMGVHTINRPLKIQQTNLTLHGEVPLVTVQLAQGGPLMLEITGPPVPTDTDHNISVMGIQFEAPDGVGPDPMIRVIGVQGGGISQCALINSTVDPQAVVQATGVSMTSCSDYAIESTTFKGFSTGIDGSLSNRIRVLDNTLVGRSFRVDMSLSVMGVRFVGDANSPPQGIAVERNVVEHFLRGIQIGPSSDNVALLETDVSIVIRRGFFGCRVVGNVVLRGRSPSQQTTPQVFAIACHVSRCDVQENMLNLSDYSQGGIIVQGGNANVARNEVWSGVGFDAQKLPATLPYGVVAYVPDGEALSCTVRGNYFAGLQQAVRAVGGMRADLIHSVDVLENRIVGSLKFVEAIIPAAGERPNRWLQFGERYASIHAGIVQHGHISHNEIEDVVCGIACVNTVGLSVEANRVKGSPVGVLLHAGEHGQATDNVIEGVAPTQLAFAGIFLFAAGHAVVERNAISDASRGILSLAGTGSRINDNTIVRGNTGIWVSVERDATLAGNAMEDSSVVGLFAFGSVHQLMFVDNRVSRCGYQPTNSTLPARGIDVAGMFGTVTIGSCQVLDTGESANPSDPPFTGIRLALRVAGAGSARVHDCVVASRPLPNDASGRQITPNASSRAIYMSTASRKIIDFDGSKVVVVAYVPPFADATDNTAEQTAGIMVEVHSGAAGEAILASNRCTNLTQAEAGAPIVDVYGNVVTATGNRILGPKGAPSFRATAVTALSAVGNVTSGGGTISAPMLVPNPYGSFNPSA